MEFKILGPLEVWHDGARVVVSGRHAPRLLAVLAAEAGRVVTVSRLADALWDDNPPETARRQVQNHVAALRRQLPDPGAIEPSGQGYRLSLDGNVVDAQAFAELVDRARGAADEAGPLLGEALGLWRGDPLEGLSGGVIEAIAKRLNESRLAALETKVDADLAASRYADIIDELRRLVERHPDRQRFAAQLMEALHHTGRTPEALEVYAALRVRLADTLGLDPNPDISALNATLLASSTESPSHPIPAQLPADTATFTGRTEHLAALDELLASTRKTAVVSAIAGMGGAGKTALAVHWAHKVRSHFPDGQLYINLRGWDERPPVTPIEAVTRFLVALGVTPEKVPSEIDEAVALYRSHVKNARVLVVLDNARTADQVRPLLPGGTSNLALITSRDQLLELTTHDDAVPVRLDTLSQAESIKLLEHILGPRRLNEDPESAVMIAQLCGHLPLALRIASANVASQPHKRLADFVSELKGPHRLDRLAINGDPAATLTRAIDFSIDVLDDASRQLLYRFGLVPGDDFTQELALRLSPMPDDQAAEGIARLESAHLVERYRPHRLRFHDLVREHVTAKFQETATPNDMVDVQDRLIGWYFERRRTLATDEYPNVLAALRMWRSHGSYWCLATCIASFLDDTYRTSAQLQYAKYALASAHKSMDPDACCLTYDILAKIFRALGDRTAAVDYARKTLAEVEKRPNGDYSGQYRSYLAMLLSELGEIEEAISLMEEALDAARNTGSQDVAYQCAGVLGSICRHKGLYSAAEKYFEIAQDIESSNPEVGHPGLIAEVARLYRDVGRYRDAVDKASAAIAVCRRGRFFTHEVSCLVTRSHAYRRLEEFDAAEFDARLALRLSVESDRRSLARDAMMALARAVISAGRYQEAQEILDSSGVEDPREDDVLTVAELSLIRSEAMLGLEEYREAIRMGLRARDRFDRMSLLKRRAETQKVLGWAYAGDGQTKLADECLHDAVEIFTRLGVPEADELRARLSTVRELSTGSSDRHTPDRPVVRGCPSWSSSWCYSPSPWPWRSP
ncbi:MAG TPA: BTAD domain-containing putative transcriptional regulator, partial [Stackebrandtia sp.]|uniref:AfsR/SARP family transcriptional regulator n=1 Tax=Stackebrandtia sp. TaxID=2023065 RepID=UPI002D3F214E